MKYIIDRFEGDYAVVEDEHKGMKDIHLKDLPKEVQEGDVLVMMEDTYHIDLEETQKRKRKTQEIMDELWNE